MVAYGRFNVSTSKVRVNVDRGNLRLRWTIAGQRFTLSLGLPDSPLNRRVAESLVNTIDLDILSGNFDPTLQKYKPENKRSDSISLDKLFDRFVAAQEKELHKNSLVRYRSTQSRLIEYFGEKRVGEIDRPKTIGFRDWMMGLVKPITVKDRVVACSTCWDWAVEHRIVQENPWSGLSVRVPSRKKEKPFSQEETLLILETFDKGEDWLYFYTDFVRFLFTTGCRIGEAIALQWTNVEGDRIWIGESVSRGERKETKNDKPRTITVPQSMAERLDRRDKSRSLVFPAPEGGLLDDKNFNRRAWRTALKIAGIEYRRPYSIRGSAITRMLRSGMSPIDVSAITGHSARTLYQCYVLPLQEGRLPEL